jgi:hypothetical protein
LLQRRHGGPSEAALPDSGALLAAEFRAMREELARSISAVHAGATAERLAAVSHEMRILYNMLATLKEVAGQQRNHLRNVENLLTTRARDGTVELELTQEMLSNEQAFLERVQQVIAEAQQPASSKPSSSPHESSS